MSPAARIETLTARLAAEERKWKNCTQGATMFQAAMVQAKSQWLYAAMQSQFWEALELDRRAYRKMIECERELDELRLSWPTG
jgi:hypothetical protein